MRECPRLVVHSIPIRRDGHRDLFESDCMAAMTLGHGTRRYHLYSPVRGVVVTSLHGGAWPDVSGLLLASFDILQSPFDISGGPSHTEGRYHLATYADALPPATAKNPPA